MRGFTRRVAAVTAAGALAATSVQGVVAGPAAADTAPPAGTPATVSADPLPTWQVNGVVWSMTTVGNTVYATGNFTKARPPGTAEGSGQEVDARNIVAFDIRTGELVTSFRHSLNGQGLRIVASPDGRRVYVGGEFTEVDGQPRSRLAAFDTATGALVPDFAPTVSAKVRAIAATNSTVYFGGNFFNVNGKSRTRLAAVRASDGSLIDAWRPTADDDEVFAMAMAPGDTRVIIGGRFQKLNGATQVGIGAVDASTGATATWTSRPIPTRQDSRYSYVTDLFVSGDTVYGSANGEGWHWFDGRFAAKASNGDLVWLDNCYGATYGIFVQDQSVYSVSHAHDCSSLGAFPETNPTTWHRALAETSYPTGTDQAPPGSNSNYSGQPVPSLLHWFPTLAMGTFTGQYQAAWAVTGNSDYIAMGGEFPRVNGVPQQGLVRFALKDKAPNNTGPEQSELGTPQAVALPDGRIRVSWKTTWDMDNNNLTYEILRDGDSTPIGRVTKASTFWDMPSAAFVDAAPPSGAHTYKVRAKDPFGNAVTSAASNAVTAVSATPSAYAQTIAGDGPADHWRLGDGGSGPAYDHAGPYDLTLQSGVTRGQAGAVANDSDRAMRFNGTSTGTSSTPAVPTPGDFSVEAWVKTTSTSGGKIIGYGNRNSGNSTAYDRHLYMTNDGRVVFGAKPADSVKTVQSGAGLNDGRWHHVVGTLDASDGMRLYVDGQQVAADPTVKNGEKFSGYWRVGGDNLGSWPNRPTSNFLNATLDEVAVYPRALTAEQVAQHYGVGTGAVTPNKPPTAAFTAECEWMTCTFDATGSTDADGSITAYAWDFGDGKTGAGATVTHTYTSPGDHTVKLTVTDDDGATDETERTVTARSQTLASDGFERTVSGGFGTADIGGPWSGVGTVSGLSVGGGVGKMTLGAPGAAMGAYLNGVSAAGTDVTVKLSVDKEGTGNGVYFWVAGRRVAGAGDYRARVRLRPSGVVSLQISRTDAGNSETVIGAEQTVSGLTYTPGVPLRLRLRVTGTAPTTLSAKVWADGAAEPDWQVTGTDATSGLQTSGGVGLRSQLSGSATNAPVVLAVDDFTARAAE
ncbi:LamG-like jellyroll fold domain-containing protein [Actinomadura rubrobrunea]|uniref:LamG-like jellyroll fold domain-containing protein n=1 Tax=Actinomadura rubrobrunea TaxID=115335 RepID=UPI0008368818|nr:LamG-like jellyroll fold domain-containing protein [Actinomadura rubrobrunea]